MAARQQRQQKEQRQYKQRYCYFCKNKIGEIDYKDVDNLKRYVSDRGKIRARRVTGTCAQHQHKIASAIKRARQMALIPYAIQTSGGKGRR